MAELTITALAGMPQVQPGHDLAGLLIAALAARGMVPRPHDVLVVTSKVVAKAEGRYRDLATIVPSARAEAIARRLDKDPRLVEAVLCEAAEVLRCGPNVLIVVTRHGLIMANAGIDQSNLDPEDQGRRVLLLPEAPDRSAQGIKARLDAHFGVDIGVIVSDSVGRPWRLGTPALWDRRGESDLAGRPLQATEVAFADAVASMAVLAMGEAAEGRPAALVRGLAWRAPARPAAALLRPRAEDLFR